MLEFIRRLFGDRTGQYAREKKILEKNDAAEIARLAGSGDTHPEILYFLAHNADPAIRKSVAENAATPIHASGKLATDKDVDVRLALSARLVRLLPDLSADRHAQLYAYAVQALGMLAQDEVFQIRRALSTALQDYAKAPPAVVSRLARDIEREVAEPILRYCVALSDNDLIDILSGHPAPWVVSTIAGRKTVSVPVSDAVLETGDLPATGVLAANTGAKLSAAGLQKIIERARDFPEWHQSIVLRPEITFDIARQLAGFMDAAVVALLEKRSDLDAATRQGVVDLVRRRLDFQRQGPAGETPLEKAHRYLKSKQLTPDVILDALAWHEKDFVIFGLSAMAEIHPQVVKKMLTLGAPRPIVALCWKAKVPMRLCVELQRQIGQIPPQEILYGRSGTGYPMTEAEIKWQLEFFGVKG